MPTAFFWRLFRLISAALHHRCSLTESTTIEPLFILHPACFQEAQQCISLTIYIDSLDYNGFVNLILKMGPLRGHTRGLSFFFLFFVLCFR